MNNIGKKLQILMLITSIITGSLNGMNTEYRPMDILPQEIK